MPKEKIAKEKLLEGLAFASDEQRKAVEALLDDEKNHDAFSERYMMRSDYSKQLDALRTKETDAERRVREAEEKDRSAEAYRQTLEEWEAAKKTDLDYADYVKTLNLNINKPPTPPTPTPAFDEAALVKKLGGQFVTMEAAAPLLRFQTFYPAALHELDGRHRAIYDGKSIENATALVDKFTKATKTFDIDEFKSFVSSELHFDTRQKELDETAVQERIKREAEEMYTKMVSERGLPAPSGEPAQSVVFADQFKQAEGRGDPSSINNAQLGEFAQINAELAKSGVKLYQ